MVKIGGYAFCDCTGLANVTISDGVTSIGSQAFCNCPSLTSIKIPSSVTSIDIYVFSGCPSLTIYCEVESQPSGWNSIWDYSYTVVWDCNNNDVANDGCIYTIIDGIRYSIKDEKATVVRQPHNIERAVIKEKITYENVSYPVTGIGRNAFSSCAGLTSIEIPNSVTSISEDTFYGCTSLTSVEIPNSITIIGDRAFSYCEGLTSIEIPNGVTSIGSRAFYGCTGLTSVKIPISITSIGVEVFIGCENLTIYCEAEIQPSSWLRNWNSYCPVVWGYKQGE